MITYCDVNTCEDCPRYGDDCDGDKRIEPTDYFCKSQLITCNRVKECNGVCPFEDALKHADKMQTMNEQHTVDHDRDWIIWCIEHDGFIKTDRFDKANQIILDALSAEAKTKCVAQIKVDTEEIVRRIKEEYDIMGGWIPCSEGFPSESGDYLCTIPLDADETYTEVLMFHKGRFYEDDAEWGATFHDDVLAWMPLPNPYREEMEDYDYELATEQMEHYAMYEPTYNPEDGSM